MRKTLLLVAVTLGGLVFQGCRQAAPPPVPAVPRAAPVRAVAPMPGGEPEVVPDTRQQPVGAQVRHRRVPQVAPLPVETQPVDAQAVVRQRQQDARLLQQQEAASQKAQQELNREVERSSRIQDQIQAEPRIQEAPGPDFPAQPVGPRIQDAPGVAQPQPVPAVPQL